MRPKDPDIARNAAELSLTGRTVEQIADILGITERTLYNWKASDWWDEEVLRAKSSARALGLLDNAYRVINDALDQGDVKTAIWAAETFDPRLNPGIAEPDKTVLDLGRTSDGPVDVEAMKRELEEARNEQESRGT